MLWVSFCVTCHKAKCLDINALAWFYAIKQIWEKYEDVLPMVLDLKTK